MTAPLSPEEREEARRWAVSMGELSPQQQTWVPPVFLTACRALLEAESERDELRKQVPWRCQACGEGVIGEHCPCQEDGR